MCMYAEGQSSNTLLRAGLVALVVANVGSYLIHRTLALPESIADPVSGFLFGVAIAAMLIGLRRQAGARRDGGARQ
jgi:hypothetical protein